MRCIAITRNNAQCKNNSMHNKTVCYSHRKTGKNTSENTKNTKNKNDFSPTKPKIKTEMDRLIELVTKYNASGETISFLKNIKKNWFDSLKYDDDQEIGAYMAYDIFEYIIGIIERDEDIDEEFFDETLWGREIDRNEIEQFGLDILRENGIKFTKYSPPEVFPKVFVPKEKPMDNDNTYYYKVGDEQFMSVELNNLDKYRIIHRDIPTDFARSDNFVLQRILKNYNLFDKNMLHKDMVYVLSQVFEIE